LSLADAAGPWDAISVYALAVVALVFVTYVAVAAVVTVVESALVFDGGVVVGLAASDTWAVVH
jgi:hypothetical protein